MPEPPVPREIDEFLAQPNPAVIGTVRDDGSAFTVATWYLWKDGRVLVNMDEGRKRLEYLRREPRVSLTVLGRDDWYHAVTLRGRMTTLEDDTDLSGIDRLSRHYLGEAYGQRDRGRVNGWIEVDSWHGWAGGRPWQPSS